MNKVHPLNRHRQIWRNHERLKEQRTILPTSPILQLVQFTWLEKVWLIKQSKELDLWKHKKAHKFSNNVILLGNNSVYIWPCLNFYYFNFFYHFTSSSTNGGYMHKHVYGCFACMCTKKKYESGETSTAKAILEAMKYLKHSKMLTLLHFPLKLPIKIFLTAYNCKFSLFTLLRVLSIMAHAQGTLTSSNPCTRPHESSSTTFNNWQPRTLFSHWVFFPMVFYR